MVAVEWGDGRVDSAGTWAVLLELLRAKQWGGLSEQTFRLEMAKRALRWSKTVIDPWVPARKFFRELERAHMLIVLEDSERSDA